MKKITVIQANENDINWINTQYAEINFTKSNYNNEFILIAKVNNGYAGIGRLVKIDNNNVELGGIYTLSNYRGLGVAENIVNKLCNENPFLQTTIWCLPFKNLSEFYLKFGFKNHKTQKIPTEIIEKLKWCNSKNRYKEEVILLCKNG